MYDLIHSNLYRQFKGVELLGSLLEEEFSLLCAHDTDAISALEFSIHELLRQIVAERLELKRRIQGATLAEYAGMLPEEDGREINRLHQLVDALEQTCSRRAARNSELSLALLDQSQSLLVFLHKQLTPRQEQCYGAGGKLKEHRPAAALYSGRS
ncbi:MAG: flagellar protein FlgN [Desulfovibrio sp.]|jgi:flagellar biosynthesis/type III secretory pathway chaperone|nr:flagellar protein FlgN [Desulfovibrio sp.]